MLDSSTEAGECACTQAAWSEPASGPSPSREESPGSFAADGFLREPSDVWKKPPLAVEESVSVNRPLEAVEEESSSKQSTVADEAGRASASSEASRDDSREFPANPRRPGVRARGGRGSGDSLDGAAGAGFDSAQLRGSDAEAAMSTAKDKCASETGGTLTGGKAAGSVRRTGGARHGPCAEEDATLSERMRAQCKVSSASSAKANKSHHSRQGSARHSHHGGGGGGSAENNRENSEQVYRLGVLLRQLGRQGEIRSCWDVWRELNSTAGLEPNAVSYGCMFDALVNNGNLDMALNLLAEMKRSERSIRPNTVIYSTLIKGCAQNKQLEQALQLFQEMKAQGVEVNTVTYNSLVDACARVGAMDKAATLLTDMLEEGIKPDLITFSTVIKGYCVHGQMDKGLCLLKAMKERNINPDGVLYNSLLDGCVKAGRPSLCMKLWKEMQALHIRPSNFTLTILIKLHGRMRQLEAAFDLVRQLPKIHHFKINAHVYTCLMAACIANGEYNAAYEVLENMKRDGVPADCKTISTIVFGCLKGGMANRAVEVVLHALDSLGEAKAASKDADPKQRMRSEGGAASCRGKLLTAIEEKTVRQLTQHLKEQRMYTVRRAATFRGTERRAQCLRCSREGSCAFVRESLQECAQVLDKAVEVGLMSQTAAEQALTSPSTPSRKRAQHFHHNAPRPGKQTPAASASDGTASLLPPSTACGSHQQQQQPHQQQLTSRGGISLHAQHSRAAGRVSRPPKVNAHAQFAPRFAQQDQQRQPLLRPPDACSVGCVLLANPGGDFAHPFLQTPQHVPPQRRETPSPTFNPSLQGAAAEGPDRAPISEAFAPAMISTGALPSHGGFLAHPASPFAALSPASSGVPPVFVCSALEGNSPLAKRTACVAAGQGLLDGGCESQQQWPSGVGSGEADVSWQSTQQSTTAAVSAGRESHASSAAFFEFADQKACYYASPPPPQEAPSCASTAAPSVMSPSGASLSLSAAPVAHHPLHGLDDRLPPSSFPPLHRGADLGGEEASPAAPLLCCVAPEFGGESPQQSSFAATTSASFSLSSCGRQPPLDLYRPGLGAPLAADAEALHQTLHPACGMGSYFGPHSWVVTQPPLGKAAEFGGLAASVPPSVLAEGNGGPCWNPTAPGQLLPARFACNAEQT